MTVQVEVKLPQWGMGISEGTVVKWLKPVGDHVAEDEPLVEVETAKATDFVTAPASGVLAEIVVSERETVPVNALLALINPDGEQ
jgi:pyruvate/2-oxoglutarate dehydrogenase complex dihydrolipoamide acyltransferase (E2) component